jgi:N-acetylglucosaminyldiphosphoundecaprenol N-acetyl-beta-D-mannosaminyltransferase
MVQSWNRKTNILSFPVFCHELKNIVLKEKTIINTLNQYSYVMAEKNSLFKNALLESDVLLPDGIGIVAACKLLNGLRIKKIAGSDVHLYLLQQLKETGGRCFYLGSSNATLERIKKHCEQEFSGVSVGYYSPPFKKQFDFEDNQRMIEIINAYNADVLFIGLSAPKQEMWVHQHKDALNVKAICSIGAVFDFYAGTINRPSKFWVNLGMEWFIRLVKEPSRLWKRYLYYGPVFLFIVMKKKVNQSIRTRALASRIKMMKVYKSYIFKTTKSDKIIS